MSEDIVSSVHEQRPFGREARAIVFEIAVRHVFVDRFVEARAFAYKEVRIRALTSELVGPCGITGKDDRLSRKLDVISERDASRHAKRCTIHTTNKNTSHIQVKTRALSFDQAQTTSLVFAL